MHATEHTHEPGARTVVSWLLVSFAHIAHCSHSRDYSTGTGEPHMLIAIGIHVSSVVPILYSRE